MEIRSGSFATRFFVYLTDQLFLPYLLEHSLCKTGFV